MIKVFQTNRGIITLRNVMVEIDDTNLEEGVELSIDGTLESVTPIGYINLAEMSDEECEEFVEEWCEWGSKD